MLGSAFPKPCFFRAVCASSRRAVSQLPAKLPNQERGQITENKTESFNARNTNNNPNNRTHIIKFRVTEKEKLQLELCCKQLHVSMSTLIRRALHGKPVKQTIVVAGGGEDALSILSDLLGQCGRIGGNLNQLARHFNSGGRDTEQLRAQLLTELSALTTFRLDAEKAIGELYGNHQTYKLEEL